MNMHAVRPSVARLASVGALTPQEITAVDDFEALLAGGGEKPVVVLFKADWCRVCTLLRGQIEDLLRSSVMPNIVALIDVDRLPVLARRFEIRHLPTLVVFEQGLSVTRCIGQRPPAVMRQVLAAALSGVSAPEEDLFVPPDV